jgi:ribosomal protein L40E
MAIDAVTRRLVRQRAGNRCEYCRCHQDILPLVTFHIEHIVARQHGGTSDASNLCLACHWCNFHKGPNLTTRVDGVLTPLFHPRTQTWDEHFVLNGNLMVGLPIRFLKTRCGDPVQSWPRKTPRFLGSTEPENRRAPVPINQRCNANATAALCRICVGTSLRQKKKDLVF